MSPLLQADTAQVKHFIYERVRGHPRFKAVIAVSADRYPTELFATIWISQEPDTEMREYAYSLESELRNLGVACSIVVKTDRELSLGGTYNLRTTAGDFSYKFYRIDPVKDEDVVYVYSLYRGREVFRFRLSLSGTLASMLRSRNRLHESRIEEIYLDWIKGEVEAGKLVAGEPREFMFTSTDISRFVGPE
jgi:hypothetical protein